MPQNIIHCRNCRTLLNTDLERDSVEVPVFIPLQEVETLLEFPPLGLFIQCGQCQQELKIARKYLGQRVQCKFCNLDFRLDPASPQVTSADVYAKCPCCQQDLRFASKYLGTKVACRFCAGRIRPLPVVE